MLLFQLGAKRVHTVRVRGGNLKLRALRLENGNFSWGSEGWWHWVLLWSNLYIYSCLFIMSRYVIRPIHRNIDLVGLKGFM